MDKAKTYTVAVGDAFGEGINLYGIFESSDDAIEYAEREWKSASWTIVEVNPA